MAKQISSLFPGRERTVRELDGIKFSDLERGVLLTDREVVKSTYSKGPKNWVTTLRVCEDERKDTIQTVYSAEQRDLNLRLTELSISYGRHDVNYFEKNLDEQILKKAGLMAA